MTSFRSPILQIAEELAQQYPQASFQNHCYLRIAYDVALGGRWDQIVASPAYQHLNPKTFSQAFKLLRAMYEDYYLVEKLNQVSLKYREAQVRPDRQLPLF